MGLRFDPIGGGQFKQAVRQIIEAERQPIRTLEQRKAREDARMKLFQEFKGKFTGFEKVLNEMATFRKFRELKAELGDGANLVSVTLDKDKAEPGTYSLQIDQLAARTSVISNSFADPEEKALGIGFIVMKLGDGESVEVFVDEENSSLRGIAALINKESSLPIRASVIQDMADPEYPWRLILTAKKDGNTNGVVFPEFYFLDGTEEFFVDDERDSQNALIQLDGFPIEAPSNQISNFLEGVNLQLRAARPDQPFTLVISEDYQKISGKMKAIVDQINGILEFINKQNTVDSQTDTRNTLAGDTGLQNTEFSMRNLLHDAFPVGDPEDPDNLRFFYITQLGVEFGKNGLLNFKEDKFTKAMQDDFEGVAQAVSGQFGVVNQLRDYVTSYTQSVNGLLSIKEQGLRNRIKQIDDQISTKERNLDRRAQALTEQFARLEASLGNLQRQQQYISASLGGGGGGNLVAQLLGG